MVRRWNMKNSGYCITQKRRWCEKLGTERGTCWGWDCPQTRTGRWPKLTRYWNRATPTVSTANTSETRRGIRSCATTRTTSDSSRLTKKKFLPATIFIDLFLSLANFIYVPTLTLTIFSLHKVCVYKQYKMSYISRKHLLVNR